MTFLKEKAPQLKLSEHSKWIDVKNSLKDDYRFKNIKSSSMRERLFDEFIMSEVLVTPGQKRTRLLEKGLAEDDQEVLKLDKSERKESKRNMMRS